MKAYIYIGGAIEPVRITEHPKGDDLVIAADAGYENARALGERPALLLGDFDSYKGEMPDGAEILRVPAEKDMTDTQLAVSEALSRGAREIVLVGGLSGRLDHTLSNLAVLRHLAALGVRAVINDGYNRVRYLENDSTLLPRSAFRFVGVLAADEVVRGVSFEGVKYPMKNQKLYRAHQFAVSNEITGNCALLSVRRGGVFVVEAAG